MTTVFLSVGITNVHQLNIKRKQIYLCRDLCVWSTHLILNELSAWTSFSHFSPSAIIKTALPNMDREAKEEYLVVIQAKDMGGHSGGLSGTTTLTVTLTDVNDNPPKFAQSKWISCTGWESKCDVFIWIYILIFRNIQKTNHNYYGQGMAIHIPTCEKANFPVIWVLSVFPFYRFQSSWENFQISGIYIVSSGAEN